MALDDGGERRAGRGSSAWFVANPSIESSLISPAEVDQLVNNDFESYYSEYAAGSFA